MGWKRIAETWNPHWTKDTILTIGFLLIGGLTGAVYALTWGSTALHYQQLLGPAAMWASGRGYINPDLDKLPQLRDFLCVFEEIHGERPPDVPSFDPATLPAEIPQKPFGAIQNREVYRFSLIAIAWRLLGIAWSSVALVQGLLYGLSCAAAYLFFRAAIRRWVSVVLGLIFTFAPLHLEYLPALRDYSKAPFIIAALAITSLVITRSLSTRALMVLSALCGSVIGIGMGFRIDVLICLPAFLGIVLLFIPDPFYGSIRKRLSAVLCCLFAFVIAGGPILVHITTGGNKGHPTMLGFMAPYSQRLGVGGTPYELAHRYLDIESLTIINAFARHENHDSPPIIYETDQFEGLASRYLSNYMKTCPADVLVRTYAATLRVLDELRAGPEHPVPIGVQNPVAQNLFRVREWVERLLLNRTRYVALLILCLLSAYSLRTGFATLGMLLYFAGYSAIQYGARNTFHLEIIPLWFAGAFLTTFITLAIGAYQKKLNPPTLPQCRGALFRVVAFLVVLSLGLAAPLYLARSIQTHNLTRLFNDYLTAPRTALASVDTTAADGSTLMTVPVLESCSAQDVPCYANDVLLLEFPPSDAETQVTFKYESDCFETNQTRTVSVPASKDTVRLLSPVYAGKWTEYLPQWIRFIGLEIPQTDIMRLPTVSHLDNPEDFPLILHMLYTPDWDEQPLYQQFLR